MTRYLSRWGISAVLISLLGCPARGQGPPDLPQPQPEARHLPKLAVAAAVQESAEQGRENVEDLLMIELGNQPFLQLVDRQALQAVMKEHAITLSNQADPKDAIALGKFAGADYLLYVLVAKDKASAQTKASVRLVEVATGQVKVDEQAALSENLALSLAAVREKILAAVRPESQAVNRVTVGIAAFLNRSGTGLSDRLGHELETAVRARLRQEAWAIVLERQYPTVLLDEVDLARAGLVRGAPETLPPAELVIIGTVQDGDKAYEPGKPWEVRLDLTVRLRDHSSQMGRTCRSDAVEAVADDIVRRVDEFRRLQPVPHADVSEKELWRRQAEYLMPRSYINPGRQPHFCFGQRQKLDTVEMIRAWENVLLLDANDLDAMTDLGVCLIALNQFVYRDSQATVAQKEAAAAQCVAGSRLVERAVDIQPTLDRVATYASCMGCVRFAAPARAKEMLQYIVDHPDLFKGHRVSSSDYWIRAAEKASAVQTKDSVYADLERAVQNVQKDPSAMFFALPRSFARKGKVELDPGLLAAYLDHPDPVVQFVVQRAMAELLCWGSRDPAALEHYDRAIAVMDAAVRRCPHSLQAGMENIYRLKVEACKHLGQPEEAKKNGLAGVAHFREAGRFDYSIGWLYQYCVTEALGTGQEKDAVALCDVYLAAAERYPYRGPESDFRARVLGKREELLARLAGTRVPDLGGLRLANTNRPARARRDDEIAAHRLLSSGQSAECRKRENRDQPNGRLVMRVLISGAAS